MKKKTQFTHPRLISAPRAVEPAYPAVGDEIFVTGIFRFHVTEMLKWLESNPQPMIEVPVEIWGDVGEKEEQHIALADLDRPILIAEIAPDYRDFVPSIPETDWTVRGYVCLDGQHRLEKAKRLGVKSLPAVVLRMEQHIQFLYSGYESYVSYWNGKLKDRTEDAHYWLRSNKAR